MILGRSYFAAGDDEAPRDRTAALYIGGVATAWLVAALFALALRLELLGPTQTLMPADTFRQLSLLRDLVFTFGVALPSIGALGHLFAPAVGATLTVRKLETLALGAFALDAALMIASTTVTGWSFLLLAASAGIVSCGAALLQAIAFVLRYRQSPAPREGQPLFAQALYITSLAELATLPVAIVVCVVPLTEKLANITLWHNAGSDPALFVHWLRIGFAPLAALAVVPCIGVLSDAIVAATGRPLAGRSAIIGALWALPLFGAVAAFAQLRGDGPAEAAVGSFFSLAMAAPLTVIVGNWLSTLAGGKFASSPASLFALAAVVLLVEFALSGLPLAMLDRGAILDASVFGETHRELLLAALGFTVAAALYQMWPRLGAATPSSTAAHLACVLGFIGVQQASIAGLAAGAHGMPRAYVYPASYQGYAIDGTIGCILWVSAAALVAGSLVMSLRRRA